MSVSSEAALAVIGLASSLTTGVFLGAYFLGKFRGHLERTAERVDDHEHRLDRYGERIEKVEGDVRAIKGHRRDDD